MPGLPRIASSARRTGEMFEMCHIRPCPPYWCVTRPMALSAIRKRTVVCVKFRKLVMVDPTVFPLGTAIHENGSRRSAHQLSRTKPRVQPPSDVWWSQSCPSQPPPPDHYRSILLLQSPYPAHFVKQSTGGRSKSPKTQVCLCLPDPECSRCQRYSPVFLEPLG